MLAWHGFCWQYDLQRLNIDVQCNSFLHLVFKYQLPTTIKGIDKQPQGETMCKMADVQLIANVQRQKKHFVKPPHSLCCTSAVIHIYLQVGGIFGGVYRRVGLITLVAISRCRSMCEYTCSKSWKNETGETTLGISHALVVITGCL